VTGQVRLQALAGGDVGGPDERGIDDRDTRARAYTSMNPMFPGLKQLLLPRRPNRGSADVAAIGAPALFQAPQSAMTTQRESLVQFLGHVGLFEDLAHRDLARVARIVHERQYSDGEYICEEGRPGAALFVVQRGVVEVVKRGAGDQDVPLALLEPPASFEESAALGTGVIRWFSVRARGPVSLLALGKSDLDGLILNFPPLANKVLAKLAGIMAARLQMLIDAEIQKESEADTGGTP
jgi:CRP-like cAMP-binding protein